MGITVNGVTIPENVANALNINGINITNVVANGITVWNQSLGPTVGWSGSSTFVGGKYAFGLNMSGMSLRTLWADVGYGAWVTANSSGIFSGSSKSGAYGYTLGSSGNMLRVNSGAWVSYTSGLFTGASDSGAYTSSGDSYRSYLDTSAGLMRYRQTGWYTGTGAYQSLT